MQNTDQIIEIKKFFFKALKNGNTILFNVLLEVLLKEFKIEEIIDNTYGANALHWAANNGHIEIVQFLVEKFPHLIDSKTPDNSTPILYAVINDHIDVVEYLTEKNASLSISGKWDKTPVTAAAEKPDDNPIKIFLKKYLNENINGENLMLAKQLEVFGHPPATISHNSKSNTVPESVPQDMTGFEFPQLNINYYDELVKSIPEEDRASVLSELESLPIRQRAEKLDKELAANEWIGLDVSESYTLFLAALRNLKSGKITAAQLASLHLFDSAIRTLYIDPLVYFIHKYVDADSKLARTCNMFALTNMRGMPTSVKRYQYNTLVLPPNMSISDLPQRMQKPLMQRFFNFTDSEWIFFCEEMKKAPITEQFFQVLIAPSEGCWSGIVSSIQKLSKCMHVLDWWSPVKGGGYQVENIMLVPSFTMLQTALNAKGNTLGRKSIQLIPTYGYIDEVSYKLLKASGVMPLALYLPERAIHKRYNSEGKFRTEIDGHARETAFGGAIHDVYHAMREMSMSESVAKARWRLVHIAKNHPKNQLNSNSRPIDEILADGELIFCYPLDKDTMFNPEYRVDYAQKLGDLFYISSIKYSLHEDLKRAFIQDMVMYSQTWLKSFNINREDLYEIERKIYDELSSQKTSAIEEKSPGNHSHNSAQTLSKIGLLANNGMRGNIHLKMSQEFKL
ncbi:ankyrin repeat domain-containing protein [Legionella jamestowniensis]|uniref:ankyrin repeat domain-containing protein n=1 Tax=Legionella jamestowniensis TaxID=455 RepID=UPI00159F1F90|nr:ankyrin repeat domain-containing protein [Legionella jamestowniensis]